MTRLPLDLYAEVETASGARFKWDANQAPGSRLRNFSFRTKIGEGFSDANGQLARRIDQDYPDLNLVNTVTFVGADGTVAYEGRLSAMPRDLSDTHSIGVTLTGWMAHAKDKKFQEIYVDRDRSHWAEPPLARKVNLLGGSISMGDFGWGLSDGWVCALPNQALGAQTISELWYTMPPGLTAAFIGYQGGTSGTLASWVERFVAYDSDDGSGATENYSWTLDGAVRYVTMTAARRYILAQVYSNGSAITPAAGASRRLDQLAVHGNHNVALRIAPDGFNGYFASDVLRDIVTRFCPQLDPSGIQDTTYPIAHLAFFERTFPYDAFLEVNKYHLWHIGVWEGKRFDFRPYDLTDYDWEIRTDDPGTTFSPQGPSTEDLFNGIAVIYTDILTGRVTTVTPDNDASLADASSTNPWNMHGVDHWDEITLSTPSTADAAVQLGIAALSERNRPKTPGTITVKGYIRDRAGNYQPCWKVRAGDTVAVTNFPNDTPRLIVETDYNDEDKTVRIAVDRPFQLLEAYLDRVGNALGARGLA